MRLLIIATLLLLAGCYPDKKRPALAAHQPRHQALSVVRPPDHSNIALRTFDRLFVTGDFDGDGITDTLTEGNFSNLRHLEIDSGPDWSKNEFETINWWYFNQQADVYIAFKRPGKDTLHLGEGECLYCLINIGDNNKDGKDEIAESLVNLDYSNVSSCKIFSLCNGSWALLQRIEIHEAAFDIPRDSTIVFTEVPRFLEKHNGQWFFHDYMWEFDGSGRDTVMKRLKLDRCKKALMH
jgi:hypothetical protein